MSREDDVPWYNGSEARREGCPDGEVMVGMLQEQRSRSRAEPPVLSRELASNARANT